jgi:hypothetical protein
VRNVPRQKSKDLLHRTKLDDILSEREKGLARGSGDTILC